MHSSCVKDCNSQMIHITLTPVLLAFLLPSLVPLYKFRIQPWSNKPAICLPHLQMWETWGILKSYIFFIGFFFFVRQLCFLRYSSALQEVKAGRKESRTAVGQYYHNAIQDTGDILLGSPVQNPIMGSHQDCKNSVGNKHSHMMHIKNFEILNV